MSHSSIEAFSGLVAAPAAIVCTSDFSEEGPLSEEERSYISSAVVSRREGFATGRRCAVAALNLIGTDVSSLNRGQSREPLWPAGTIGTITHCEGLCAAAAAPSATVRFLGIDAEPNVPLTEKLLERISSLTERQMLARSGGSGFTSKTLFSAKESIFKALYPKVRVYFGFEEVEISLPGPAGVFEAELSPMLQDHVKLDRINGRFATAIEHTMTVIQIPAV